LGKSISKRAPARLELRPVLIIVPEGQVTEVQYFNHLRTFKPTMHIKIDKHASNGPKQLKRRLLELMGKADVNKSGVSGWIVLDRDNWSEKEIREVYDWQEKEPRVRIAMTDPKFEWWLALHFEDFPSASHRDLEKLLEARDALRGNNKKEINSRVFGELEIISAIRRATNLRNHTSIPGSRETDVHLLVRQILPETIVGC
jgi:hypothetical protein